MPRKRTRSDSRLPAYVSLSKGRYVWRPYLGRRDGRTVFGKEIVLCRGDATIPQVWDAYNQAARDGPAFGTIDWLLDRFFASRRFAELASRTQQDYRKYRAPLTDRRTRAGRFGETELRTITTRSINSYLATAPAPVQANRQIAMLSSAWNWVAGEEPIPPNPVPGCRWNAERARDRYVEDWEYQAVYTEASPALRVAMELAYLCRLRRCEVIALECLRDLRDDGVLARRRKGSRHQVVGYSQRLEAAIAAAKALHGKVQLRHLIITRRGDAYTDNGLSKSFDRARARALRKGTLRVPFNFHDLKRKGVSDFEGTDTEKLDSAGHRDRRTAEIYNVRPSLTRPTR